MYKLEIICPFCLENLNRWKLVKLVSKSYPIVIYTKTGQINSTRHTTEISNEKEVKSFETKVLQEHLDKCSSNQYLSRSCLKDCYGINR